MTDASQRSELSGLLGTADRVFCALHLDRIAGGRHGLHRVPEASRVDPAVVRVFRLVRILLGIETTVGAGALAFALALASSGASIPLAVWLRATVVLLITLSLYVFAWRAQLGYWWAYSRLRLFSAVFPVVTLALAAIPGLYPLWMIVEQVLFAGFMLGIGVLLRTAHMRSVFQKPPRCT